MTTPSDTIAPSILDLADMPLVALESMNDTHREELDLVNRLGALLCQQSPEIAGIDSGIGDWIAHTQAHFAAENALMRTYGFPAYAVHSGEHTRVLDELDGVQRTWLVDRDLARLRDYLFVAWPQWFMRHVNTMDMVTASFLSASRD